MVNFFEDRIKLKITSEIIPPLSRLILKMDSNFPTSHVVFSLGMVAAR